MSASVLFMMLLGSMKVCQAVYTYHYISEAARDATRYAIVRGFNCDTTKFTTACPAGTDDISNYVKGLGYPGISSSAITVTTSWAGYPSGVVCTPDPNCKNNGNLVTVKVQYAFPATIPFFGTKTWNMTSTSAMIIAD